MDGQREIQIIRLCATWSAADGKWQEIAETMAGTISSCWTDRHNRMQGKEGEYSVRITYELFRCESVAASEHSNNVITGFCQCPECVQRRQV